MAPDHAHLLVGEEVSNISTTRRGTAAAGMIPVLTMPNPPGPSVAPLVRGTVLRKADMRVPIRVQQSGGQPTHTAPKRRGNPRGRSPPNQAGSRPDGGDQEPLAGFLIQVCEPN
jgi:hypothetical protein